MRTIIIILIVAVVIAICVLLFYKPKASSGDEGKHTKYNKGKNSDSNGGKLPYKPDTYDNDDYEAPTKRY